MLLLIHISITITERDMLLLFLLLDYIAFVLAEIDRDRSFLHEAVISRIKVSIALKQLATWMIPGI